MFLMVVLYLDIWKEFIRNPTMYEGLRVVPILLIANIFLGVYYNLSIWYKLSNKTMAGAWITLLGAVITIIINFIAIPYFSYMASAWATLVCYGTMMYVSYKWGQKVYPIPYATKKLIAYFVITLLLYGIYIFVEWITKSNTLRLSIASVELIAFIVFVSSIEKKELKNLLQKKTAVVV
jgi:O-antigen/teichoic acid export membrane protein